MIIDNQINKGKSCRSYFVLIPKGKAVGRDGASQGVECYGAHSQEAEGFSSIKALRKNTAWKVIKFSGPKAGGRGQKVMRPCP